MVNIDKVEAQPYLPIIKNELGDTITYNWPILDTNAFSRNEIIIKFRKNALRLEKLCFSYEMPTMLDGDNDIANIYKSQMMSEQFPIDSLIIDSVLKTTLHQLGGIYLKRITAANPCTDTLSITRYGDTIKCANFLWMTMKLNNDTSVINSCLTLSIFFQDQLDIAEPDFYGQLNAKPIDPFYDDYINKQKSLWPSYTNCERAWDFQTGSDKIIVGVIDNGIYFSHCDLGPTIGPPYKVIDGWNYHDESINIQDGSSHGTQMAGIIGAYTNGTTDGCTNAGIAGIAGGWLEDNKGCKLIGLKVKISSNDDESIGISEVIGAVLDAASNYTTPHEDNKIHRSFAVHILNCSFGFKTASPSLRDAFNYAFENGVSIVCSRGNIKEDNPKEWYPANFDPSWIFSVGGLDAEHVRISNTWYGDNMDILAPAYLEYIYTTNSDGEYIKTGETSAAAAHVSGATALLRSEFLENNKYKFIKPEPEDYQNIIKAAAFDLNYDPNNQDVYMKTYPGYDNVSGWGELKIGNIFEMLNNGHNLFHDKITVLDTTDEFTSSKEVLRLITRTDEKVEEKIYKAQRREIRGTKTLEGFESSQLFVWGRSGHSDNKDKGGLSKAQPLYKSTKYTEVTSGQGGNGIIDDGIYHNHSFDVSAKTYQYKLFDFNTEEFKGYEPELNNIELNISIFGKLVPISVRDNTNNESTIIAYPNPATDNYIIKFKTSNQSEPKIKIFNSLGLVTDNLILNTNPDCYYEVSINTLNYPPGIYTIQISSSNQIQTQKIMVIK